MLIRRFIDMQTNRHYQYVRNRQGSVTAVVDDCGKTVQRTGYYPSGTPYILPCDYSASSVNSLTPVTDRLHIGNIWIGSGGLNLYDNTARLHDPILCSFTTPDPQAFKYPGINPFSHCAGNPTNIIDPTGEDIYYLTQYGVIYDVTPNTELIQFFILKDGVEVEIFNEKNKNPDIVTMEHKKREDGVDYDLYTIKNDKIAKQLFEALAQNTKVEWGHIIPKGKNKNNYITTSHLTNRDVGVTRESKLAAYHNDISYIIHSHPGNTPDPSGINDWESDNVHSDIKAGLNINLVIYYLNGGKKNFDNIKKKFPTYKIYTPGTNKYHPYQIPLELISDKK